MTDEIPSNSDAKANPPADSSKSTSQSTSNKATDATNAVPGNKSLATNKPASTRKPLPNQAAAVKPTAGTKSGNTAHRSMPNGANSSKPKKSKTTALWLIVFIEFLLIAVLAGAAYYAYEQWQTMQTQRSDEQTASKSELTELRKQIQANQAAQQTIADSVEQLSGDTLGKLNNDLKKTLDRFKSFESSVAAINKRLTELSPRDEQQWMIAQIEYFLDMAQYRLTLTGDSQGAALLLDQASAVTAQLRSPDAQRLMQALSNDRAELKVEGQWQPEVIHAQINALISQIDELSTKAYNAEDFASIGEQLKTESKNFDKVLSKFVRIQKTNESIKPLLDDTTRKQVEQHLFMLLTEAQLNLMRQNQSGFKRSLKQAEQVVTEAFDASQKQASFFLEELKRLQKVEVGREVTSLTSSQQALRNLVKLFEQKK